MTDKSKPSNETVATAHSKRHWLWGSLAAAVASILAACGIAPSKAPSTSSPADSGAAHASHAPNARAYRKDAAQHLYRLNQHRIYQGTLPPMLYAVGVLEVHLGKKGEVRSFHWLRKPSHAPEVVREIERTVRAAAPFPAASRLGYVTYTDTWLWDRSGRFQLDTLTEGQRDSS